MHCTYRKAGSTAESWNTGVAGDPRHLSTDMDKAVVQVASCKQHRRCERCAGLPVVQAQVFSRELYDRVRMKTLMPRMLLQLSKSVCALDQVRAAAACLWCPARTEQCSPSAIGLSQAAPLGRLPLRLHPDVESRRVCASGTLGAGAAIGGHGIEGKALSELTLVSSGCWSLAAALHLRSCKLGVAS